MSGKDIVDIALGAVGGLIIWGAVQVLVIRAALEPIREDLRRLADRFAPDDEDEFLNAG